MKQFTFTAIATVLALPTVVSANGIDGGHMTDWGSGMMGGGWGVLGLLTWVVWLIVGVLLIIWLVRQISKK